jgi:hypothetical protein
VTRRVSATPASAAAAAPATTTTPAARGPAAAATRAAAARLASVGRGLVLLRAGCALERTA